MKKLIILNILAILFFGGVALNRANSLQATADFTVTFTFQGANQTQANNRRDQAVLDYAKARGLAIYDTDGTTVVSALVAPAVRADIKARLKEEVVRYRAIVAANTATAGIKGQLDTELP